MSNLSIQMDSGKIVHLGDPIVGRYLRIDTIGELIESSLDNKNWFQLWPEPPGYDPDESDYDEDEDE